MQILPRKLSLNLANVKIENKVEDGSDIARFTNDTEFILSNIVAGENIYIINSKVEAKYEDSTYGEDKTVVLNLKAALGGDNTSNYDIDNATIENNIIIVHLFLVVQRHQ